MKRSKIDDGLTVAYQIDPDDVRQLAAEGFRAIVCNRPDDEEPGQPAAAEIAKAAQECGIAFHHIPTTSGQFPKEVIDAFRTVREQADGPVFAYCRTGTRCATIDALANPDGKTADEILQAASAAGYDLSAIRDRIPSR